jgi:hypothetical protein
MLNHPNSKSYSQTQIWKLLHANTYPQPSSYFAPSRQFRNLRESSHAADIHPFLTFLNLEGSVKAGADA